MKKRAQKFARVLALFAVPLMASMAEAETKGAPPPPPIPLVENDVVTAESATLVFHVPHFANPIAVTVHLRPYDVRRDALAWQSFDVVYGKDTAHFGPDMLADISSPNLTQLRASTLLDWQGHAVVIVYVYRTENCDDGKGTGCGVVEFSWTEGEGVKKIDHRVRPSPN